MSLKLKVYRAEFKKSSQIKSIFWRSESLKYLPFFYWGFEIFLMALFQFQSISLQFMASKKKKKTMEKNQPVLSWLRSIWVSEKTVRKSYLVVSAE